MGEKVYIFVGKADGQFTVEDGEHKGEVREYANMFVLERITYSSDDYHGRGFKAEKLRCISADVYTDLEVGEIVKLYFDGKRNVALVVSTGDVVSLDCE